MKQILPFLCLMLPFCFGANLSAQNKKLISDAAAIFSKITPNEKLDFWEIIHQNDGVDTVVKSSGKVQSYTKSNVGFQIAMPDEGFYYIVYSKNKKINYITQSEDLKSFIGKIDHECDAILLCIANGYRMDLQFADVAGNYHSDDQNYYVQIGKLTSEKCPYQKKHYGVKINKRTGEITSIQENGTYIEVYTKDCENHPRLQKKQEPIPVEPIKKEKRSKK